MGPDTWVPVADVLKSRGYPASVPVLRDDGSPPFWRQHVASIVDAVTDGWPGDRDLVLAAHSGAGQIMAVAGRALLDRGSPVAAYIPVDAGLPTRSGSRLSQLDELEPRFGQELRAVFDAGGRWPTWTDEQLRPLVPDQERRRRLVEGIRQLPRQYWEEPLPVVESWPEAPVGVLQLSSTYDPTTAVAEQRDWPVRRLPVENHFHMLVDEETIASHLIELAVALLPS